VLAAADGVVVQVRRHARAGLYVTLRHAGGHYTRYLHLSRRVVREGQRVRGGQRLGAVGTSGNVTGPHLHFELFRVVRGKRRYVDPEPRLLTLGAPRRGRVRPPRQRRGTRRPRARRSRA
jgi:murein DD-endopeptidase MepM/ murein hydrolase activator NlpD